MSSRAHRWEAGKSPLSAHHGGSAAAAKAAVKAAQIDRYQQFQRAREIAHRQMAERSSGDIAEPKSPPRRLRPRARPDSQQSTSRWNCRTVRLREASGEKPDVWRPHDWKEAEARRMILIEVQNGMCALCGVRIGEDQRGSDRLRPTIEHVIPRDLGGTNERNLTIAHSLCNAQKNNDLPTGCELIWLLTVNARLSLLPKHMQKAFWQ